MLTYRVRDYAPVENRTFMKDVLPGIRVQVFLAPFRSAYYQLDPFILTILYSKQSDSNSEPGFFCRNECDAVLLLYPGYEKKTCMNLYENF